MEVFVDHQPKIIRAIAESRLKFIVVGWMGSTFCERSADYPFTAFREWSDLCIRAERQLLETGVPCVVTRFINTFEIISFWSGEEIKKYRTMSSIDSRSNPVRN